MKNSIKLLKRFSDSHNSIKSTPTSYPEKVLEKIKMKVQPPSELRRGFK
jgi:hypothetical protein